MKKRNKDLIYESDDIYNESDRREKYYSILVKDIIDNNRTSQRLKKAFFIIVCSIFAFICVVGLLIIYNISKKDIVTINDIGIALTGFGSILSSVIILPQIIAKHLFPENSEEVRFGFVKDNQKADQAFFDNSQDDIEI